MLQTLISLLGVVIFAVIAYGDVRTRRIPNEFAIAIGVLGLAHLSLVGNLGAALYTIAAAAAVFAVGFLLFWRGLLGGGDVKLLAASTLLIGYHELIDFLVIMSFCGAVLAIGAVAEHKVRLGVERLPFLMRLCGAPLRLTASVERRLAGWLYFLPHRTAAPAGGGDAMPKGPTVPYGLAIAAAGVLVLVLQSTVPG